MDDDLLASLPPLPEPNLWEMRSEACCGSSLVLGLVTGFVAATRQMSHRLEGHVPQAVQQTFVVAIHLEALVAMICLFGLWWGDPGVVKRTRENCLPIPEPVKQALQAGRSLDHLQNVTEDGSSYCVRCCMWRRTRDATTTSACFDDGGLADFHHCSTCQRCVANFDHHCGVFGRCIAGKGFGGNMGFFKTIIAMGVAGGATCFGSAILALMQEESSSMLGIILLAYATPMFLGCCVFLCSLPASQNPCKRKECTQRRI
ncbi:unnamed protein product [Effrenium voratum]|nr:unnamed protein product [Effrenium voratum]